MMKRLVFGIVAAWGVAVIVLQVLQLRAVEASRSSIDDVSTTADRIAMKIDPPSPGYAPMSPSLDASARQRNGR